MARLNYLYLLLSLGLLLIPVKAAAFSGQGAGTNGSPYLIETCDELQEMNGDLTADYQLVSDIDCSGKTDFAPIASFSGTHFSGSLDGNNFAINGLSMTGRTDYTALFVYLEDATVRNLHFNGGTISTSSFGASLANFAKNSTITNVSSKADVTSSSTWAAGIVTVGYQTTSLSKVSYDGDVTATAYAAGLMSVAYDSITISDSLVAGTMNTNIYPGSVIGGMAHGNTATVERVYSTATINADGVYIGGMFGTVDGSPTLSDLFYAGVMNIGSSTYHGAIIGTSFGTETRSNIYYDEDICGSCTQGGAGNGSDTNTTAISGNASYFKGNSSNPPLDQWDFSSVWQTVTGDYPILRVASAPTAPSAPAGFTATKLGDSVSLDWSEPAVVGSGTRFDYEIQYKTDSDSVWTTYTHTANPNLTKVELSGLTIGETYSFRIRALNSIVYGSRSNLNDEALISGAVAINLPAGLKLLSQTTGDDLTKVGATGTVTAELIDSETGLVLSSFEIDLSTNRDLSGIGASADLESGRAVLSGIEDIVGVGETHTLYVPKKGDEDKIVICPLATTLAEVVQDCVSALTYMESDENVSVITIDSQIYWKITGLTGTGGISLAAASSSATLAPTGDNQPLILMVVISMLLISFGGIVCSGKIRSRFGQG